MQPVTLHSSSVDHGTSDMQFKNILTLSLNVCGLQNKLCSPEFEDLFQIYDFLLFQEIKCDDDDYDFVNNALNRLGLKVFMKKTRTIRRFNDLYNDLYKT